MSDGVPRRYEGGDGIPPVPAAPSGAPTPVEVLYEREMDLRDFWSVLRRRRWIVAGTLATVLTAVALYTWTKVPVWQASALIRIDDPRRSSVTAVDLITALQRGSEIETEMHILSTRPILADAVDRLDLHFRVLEPRDVPRHLIFERIEFGRQTPKARYAIRREGDAPRLRSLPVDGEGVRLEVALRPGEPLEVPGGSFAVASGAGRAAGLPGELRVETVPFTEAVEALQKELEVMRPDRRANIVRVSYQGTDRELVRQVPDAIAAGFIAERQRVQKTEVRSTVAFLQEQSELLRSQLEAAERELQAFRQGQQIVALGTEAEAQVQRLAELQTQRTQLAAERQALANLIDGIDAAAGERPDYRRLAAFPTFLRNQAIADILQQLTAATRSRIQLLGQLTQEHPDVVALDLQIDALEGQLGEIGRNYLQSLNDQIASLDAVLTRFGAELEEIPAKEVQFARLERQTKLLAELYTLLQTRLKEAEIAEAVDDPTVRIVEASVLSSDPVSPRPARNMALAGILGLLLGVGLAFVRDYFDNRVHSTEDVEGEFGVPAIGRIPTLPLANGRPRGDEALVTLQAGPSVGAEAFRILRTNVRYVRDGIGAREIVVTSPGPREGKSLTAANLAVAFAQQGIRTVLVDADMRRSVQHLQFGLPREPGLSDVLAGGAELDAVRATETPGLAVLPAGAPVPNPAELLGSRRLAELFAELRDRFEAIVIDSPPMLAVTDASVLGRNAEGVVLVVRAEQTDRDAVLHALAQLRQVGATVLGLVVNDTRADGAYGYYRAYYGEDGGPPIWRRLLQLRG